MKIADKLLRSLLDMTRGALEERGYKVAKAQGTNTFGLVWWEGKRVRTFGLHQYALHSQVIRMSIDHLEYFLPRKRNVFNPVMRNKSEQNLLENEITLQVVEWATASRPDDAYSDSVFPPIMSTAPYKLSTTFYHWSYAWSDLADREYRESTAKRDINRRMCGRP